MAGHSHWKQIKEHKSANDKKRGKVFSKILNAISIAAKNEPNKDFNPRLRTVILKAREMQIPQENIDRAIKRASDGADSLKDLIIGCYGPGGTAILITAISNNTNRTINEIKQIIKEYGGKLAEPGSVRYAFKEKDGEFAPEFTQEINEGDKSKLEKLLEAINEQDDIQSIYHNGNFGD